MEQITLKELNDYIDDFKEVLNFLSFKNFEMPVMLSYRNLWSSITPGIDSSIKTLEGIKQLLAISNFVDIYVLLRKLRDNLFFDCVIAQDAESNHPNLTDVFFKPFVNEDGSLILSKVEDALRSFVIDNIVYELDNQDKDRIEKWKNNEIRKTDNKKDKWVGYFEFKCKLENNALIKKANDLFLDKHLSSLQRVTNSYVHTLTFDKSNNYSKTNEEHIKQIYRFLRTIKVSIISYLMLIKSRIFSSSDYLDALDAGETPIEGSQYWIAPLIQDELKEIKIINKKLYYFLKRHNTNSMDFGDGEFDA